MSDKRPSFLYHENQIYSVNFCRFLIIIIGGILHEKSIESIGYNLRTTYTYRVFDSGVRRLSTFLW